MKPGGDQWQVDDELLTETGRGGLFTDGYLKGRALISYLDAEETPLFVFGSGKRGITRERSGETERVVPGSGYRAITAITDRRVQFVVGGGREDGDWDQSVRLSDIDRVTVDSGLIREQLTIDANDGSTYHVYLRDIDTERVVSFLEEVSWAWIEVEELLDDARKHLVDASQSEKSHEYDAAKDAIARARQTLDKAAGETDNLTSEASSGIHDRIDHVERRYRETKRRVHASRATHLVDEAERQWRADQFERAYEQFRAAREEYCTILDIYGLDPDKADAMRERIAHVDGNLEHLSKAPLRSANQACSRARDASTPEDKLEHWKDALERYRCVIELDWGHEQKRFEGDLDLVRDRVVGVVEEILATRRELTDDRVERAEQLLEANDYTSARTAYVEAMDHLEAATNLAREFDPEAVPELQDRLETLDERIREATTAVSLATENETGPETGAESGEESASAGGSGDSTGTDYDDFDNWVTLADDDGSDDQSQPTGLDPIESDEQPQFDDRIEGDEGTEREDDSFRERVVEDSDPDDAVVEAIETLDALELSDLVETIWSTLGWSTTGIEDPPGVRANRESPMAEELVLGVVADGTATEGDIANLVDRRDAGEADRGVLVTNVTAAPSAARHAIAADVELIDSESLAGIVERESLTDRLPDATV